MGKHTPGPWQVAGCRCKWRDAASDQVLDSHAVGPDGDSVCLVFYTDKHHSEQLANARLIAAAPDLLAALKRAEQFIENGVELGYIRMPETQDPAHQTLPSIQAAIAKAEGR